MHINKKAKLVKKMAYNKKVLPVDESDRPKNMVLTLKNAQDFMRAYQFLKSHNKNSANNGSQLVFNATVTNLAFAIELFLKAILYGAGLKANGHNIEELFGYLPPEMQSKIKDAYNRHLIATNGHCRDFMGISFEARLQQHSNIYNDWRYYHEANRGTFNSQFYENLAHVLNQIAQMQEIQLRTLELAKRMSNT